MKLLFVILALIGFVHSFEKCRTPIGQFPHELWCEMYYNCWDNEAVLQTCPAGLAFDDKKNVCSYTKEVDCGTRHRKTREIYKKNPLFIIRLNIFLLIFIAVDGFD